MMNAIIFTSMVCFGISIAASAQSKWQQDYRLEVDCSNLKEKSADLVLQYPKRQGDGVMTIKKKAVIKDGKAVFRGELDAPLEWATIWVEPGMAYTHLSFFLQGGDMHLTTGKVMAAATVSGPYTSLIDRLGQAEQAFNENFNRTLTEAERRVNSEDPQAYVKLMARRSDGYDVMLDTVYKPFIERYAKASPVAVYALEKYAGDTMLLMRTTAIHAADSLYQLLDPQLQRVPAAMAVKRRIETAKRLDIGTTAPDFSQADTSGRIVSLSSFRGQYVLLDFWASWCHWCRVESPDIIQLFDLYHDRRFTVVSVSMDAPAYREAWRKAIVKDGTGIWTQLCEFSADTETNTAATLYGIRAIPQNFLIDPEGHIIGVNLHGDKLKEMLNVLFASKN